MRRRVVLPAVAVVLALTPLAVVSSAAAAPTAAAHCSYTPNLAKRIVVDRPTLAFHTPVQISGSGCAKNFSASESLARHGDRYFLAWQYNSRTSTNNVYASTVVPGTYRTATDAQCTTYDTDGNSVSCSVGAGSTVIKFAGAVGIEATRLSGSKSDEVQFTVRARRYSPSGKIYVTTDVAIQHRYSGAWHTIHTAQARGSKGYVWTYTNSNSARYRAVVAQTRAAFAGVSATVTQ